jgi:hypothetical protein
MTLRVVAQVHHALTSHSAREAGMLVGRALMPKVLGLPRPQLFISVRSLLSVVVRLSG